MVELVLCDDEKIYRNDLKKLLGTELELSGIDYRVTEFSCGEDLLSGLPAEGLHIIFLDIEMKDLDGVETAKKLRMKNSSAVIIFVTSHPDFVFQGYEVRALNYILKPYKPEKIKEVLHKALEALDVSTEKYLCLEQRSGAIRIPLSSIRYFTSDKRIVRVVTDNGTYDFYDKLNDLETKLSDAFVRIHNRYLIHLKYLNEIQGNQAIVDGESLPVSRSCKSALSIAFAKFMLQ